MSGLTDFADARERLKVMTLEYTNVSEGNFVDEPVVELFCRDAKGNRRRVNVHDYYPHFYITESEFFEKKETILKNRKVRTVRVDGRTLSKSDAMNGTIEPVAEPPRTTLDGTDLVQVFTVVPSDVADLREHIDDHFEADVFFTNRFIVDSGLKTGIEVPFGETDVSFDDVSALSPEETPTVTPRMVTVDIEVWAGDNFPDTQDPKKPVTAITGHDTYEDEYFCGVLHPDSVEQGAENSWKEKYFFGQPLSWELPDGVSGEQIDVTVYQSERTLLEEWNKWVIGHDPDLLTGWNSSRNDIGSGFDYPYLINRSERLNVWNYRELGYDNGGVFVTNRGTPVVSGTEMFDMLQAYKKTQIHEKRSYSLEYIAQQELGYGKEDIDNLDEGWLHNPENFIKYNIRDTEAVVEIEKSKSVLKIYDHIRSITGATYSEIADSNIGIIDILFLRRAKENGYALPTSERPDVQHYWGAYVFEPISGKHKNVVYPDLKCFTPDHDVLTTDGVKSIQNVTTDDTVYSINPDTGEVEIKPVVETYEYPGYSGELVNFSGTRIDFSVTPNHQMLYQDSDEYVFESAGEFDGERRVLPNASSGVSGAGIDTFDMTDYLVCDKFDVRCSYDVHGHTYRSNLPDGCEKKRANYHEGFFFDGETFKNFQDELEELSANISLSHPSGGGSTFRPYKFDGDLFIRFLGWFIAEGSVYEPEGTETAVVQIVQHTHEEEVSSLFDEMGISYSVTDGAYTIGSKIYGEFFKEYTGKNSYEKRIPEFVFENASIEQKDMLLETLMKGDGHNNTYYTSSERLAEDVCRLAVECGKKPKLDSRRGSEYEVTITTTNDGVNDYQHSISTANNGVYCIEVAENNTMMVGKNGKFQWCGNSLYPNLFRDMNASPETIIGDEDALRESQYTADDCQVIYVDPRDEDVKKDADEPERKKLYVLKPEVKESFVREIVDELIDMKYEYKKDEYSDEAYGAIKRITNSVYGVMGDSVSYGKGFRLFDWRIAEAITLAGRDVIKHTADTFESRVQSMGYTDAEIIAGDTDSCVCTIPSADGLEETLDVAQDAAEYVDNTYPDFMEERFGIQDGNMAVEIESYAQAALFMDVKKRYAQWVRWDEGDYVDEIEYKGLELVRSDSATITGDIQRGVIERVLKNDNAKESVGHYLEREWNKATSGDVALEKIGKPSKVNSSLMDYGWSKDDDTGQMKYYTPQPHIRGARYANIHIDGESITSGDKPLMFYTESISAKNNLPEVYDYDNSLSLNAPQDVPDQNRREMKEIGRKVDAITVANTENIPEGISVDFEKMANKSIRQPVEPILTVMGWSFDDLVTKGTQTGLSNYM
jgi:DNA polymerase I